MGINEIIGGAWVHKDPTYAFLAKYSDVHNTHDFFPTDISVKGPPPFVNEVLAVLSDDSLTPIPANNDEPLWAQALASHECK